MWKNTGLRIAKAILRKKTKVGDVTLLQVKSYSIAIVIKTVLYYQRNRLIKQDREHRDKCKYVPLIIDKGIKAIE